MSTNSVLWEGVLILSVAAAGKQLPKKKKKVQSLVAAG